MVELQLDPAAEDALLNFGHALEKRLAPGGDLSDCKDWANKLEGAVCRIAGILHLAEGHAELGQISRDTVDKATWIVRALVPHALAAWDMLDHDPVTEAAKRALVWLEAKGKKRVRLREITQFVRAAKNLGPAVARLLVEHGYLRRDKKARGKLFILNPRLGWVGGPSASVDGRDYTSTPSAPWA
jgi:hypothetical protein